MSSAAAPAIKVAGRVLQPTAVFDTYWHFAAERQRTYFRRIEGDGGPWTTDPILARHRFTNAFRAADRVSQYLIRHVLYGEDSLNWEDRVFRVLLFKFFNRIETWQMLDAELGPIRWSAYDHERYAAALDRRRDSGERLYSAAYVIPPPRLGEATKHRNHLRLLELMMAAGLPAQLAECRRMADAYALLTSFPSVGAFLGFQFLIDLNYGPDLGFSEMDFVVAGPGARDGIRKCFGAAADGIEDEIIRWMADHQHEQFERLGIAFQDLWGRPLQLIDAQNLFCEVDKYSRVAHPEISGHSGRSRIKQVFRPSDRPATPWFPPHWGLNGRIERVVTSAERHTAGAVVLRLFG